MPAAFWGSCRWRKGNAEARAGTLARKPVATSSCLRRAPAAPESAQEDSAAAPGLGELPAAPSALQGGRERLLLPLPLPGHLSCPWLLQEGHCSACASRGSGGGDTGPSGLVARPPACFPSPRRHRGGSTGDSQREAPGSIQTTAGKQLRARLQRCFRFPRGFNSERARGEGREEKRLRGTRGGRSTVQSCSSHGGHLHPAHRAAGLREEVFPQPALRKYAANTWQVEQRGLSGAGA